MKKILHLTLFLGLISAIAGGVLALVNDLTAPIIKENEMASEKIHLDKLIPNGEFSIIEVTNEDLPIIKAFKDDNSGFAIKAEVQGYKDKIVFFTVIDNDGVFKGFSVLENNDTVGIGSRVGDDEFSKQFIGESVDTQIDTLAGATISSKAVIGGIQSVVDFYNANK